MIISDSPQKYVKPSLILVILLVLFGNASSAATQIEIIGPVGSGSFGEKVITLPNGNFIVTDITFDILSPGLIQDVGAVYLYTENGILISRLTGNCANDNLGSGGIEVLSNGNYVISSPQADVISLNGTFGNNCLSGNSTVIRDAGAVTLVSGSTGVNGVVSSANSFTGSFNDDRVSGIVKLPNGNYIIPTPFWNNGRGAVTWRNGTTPATGTVSEANSLISQNTGYYGSVKVLSNGNYVVYSSNWNNTNGVATFCGLQTGCTGIVSSANSLIGTSGGSIANGGVVELANGNYAVISSSWNGNRGAVTFGNGNTGVSGEISSSNSLIGNNINDRVGSGGVTRLTNGNYVVNTPSWDSPNTADVGAATFGNGTTGITGIINSSNSLTGSQSSDFFLSKIIALTNGNYVVELPRTSIPGTNFSGAAVWGNGANGIVGTILTSNSLYRGADVGIFPLTNGNYVVVSRSTIGTGAVTFGNGATGITGEISASNSLVGSSQGDNIGFSGGTGTITALTNGNYVVASSDWDNGSIFNAGAVTFCSGTTGMIGVVSSANSLVGTKLNDEVGYGGITALSNGNYVVRSIQWDNGVSSNVGAITFGNGITGRIGEVSTTNSLVGSNADDKIGINGITPLPNGNYVATSFAWNNRGAVTWGNGTFGTTGVVSALNSIVGSNSDDRVGTLGNNNSVKVFSDSSFTAHSANWNNGSIVDAGAVSLGKRNSQVAGEINNENSVRGTIANTGTNLAYDYNPLKKYLIVGSFNSKIVTVFRHESAGSSIFDFDGDGKSDISVFRPLQGVWYASKSSDSQVLTAQWGIATDKIVPTDYNGDGKTDYAVFRDGFWYILNNGGSFEGFQWGSAGDIPFPADFDADGKADLAVFRNGTWFVRKSSGGTTTQNWGSAGDIPLVADYDADGKADFAVFRNGIWYVLKSTGGNTAIQWGIAGDKNVQADYNGDGKADYAVFRNGFWYILLNGGGFQGAQWGAAGDLPAPADYDGDGRTDLAVFRNGVWYIQRTTAGVQVVNFGSAGDKPLANAFVP